jgi:hypothetical protein
MAAEYQNNAQFLKLKHTLKFILWTSLLISKRLKSYIFMNFESDL